MLLIVFLILLGVLFLVAELVLLPGVSVGALFAIICYGSAIYKAYADYGAVTGTVVVIAVIIVSIIATIVSLRTKTWQRLSLKQKIDSSSMEMPEQTLHVGDRGTAISRLAPMGKIEIAGRNYEAKSVDAYIDQRSSVEVVGFENFTVIVRKPD